MTRSRADREILRELGHRLAEIGNLPEQQERAGLWRRHNRLEDVRPLVWINEIPWHEMNVDNELTLRCEDEFCRRIEDGLRKQIYQWNHLRADMVVEPVIYSPYVFHDTGHGLEADRVRPEMEHGASQYRAIIRSREDVLRIGIPVITADWEATERNYERMSRIFDGVIRVRKRGVPFMGCAPWDVLIGWYGIEQLYLDMIDRPELVHAAISRMMDAVLARLDQMEAQNLLAVGNGNHRVGSGGLGITDELPGADYDPQHVTPRDQWGSSMGQIFSEVSPAMHDEFCLQYEKRWLERFGLTYYGCCEPLHNKMGILRTIPNLRAVSMSPFVDLDKAAEEVGRDYIFSAKPNPSVLAWDSFQPEAAQHELSQILEKAGACHLQLIMKDIHTVRNEPQRLWQWSELAMQMVRDKAESCAA